VGRIVTDRGRAWRHARLESARLYLCVDLRREAGDLEALLEAALEGGVDIVQLRDKKAGLDAVADGADAFRSAAERHDALFIVNDYPELAAAVGADGVHVGQQDPDPGEARADVGPNLIVGRSTHSVEQFERGTREDVDYLAIGPVHETPTKQGRPGIGIRPLERAAAIADRPWFVTGGMTPETIPEVLAAGARRVVVVRGIVEAPDPRLAAQELASLLAVTAPPSRP
jgi:thiamine-phosphate pyrophosphorylase